MVNSRRSMKIGMDSATLSSPGKAKITRATLNACKKKRGATPIGRMSSAAPTAAITITAARRASSDAGAKTADADK